MERNGAVEQGKGPLRYDAMLSMRADMLIAMGCRGSIWLRDPRGPSVGKSVRCLLRIALVCHGDLRSHDP